MGIVLKNISKSFGADHTLALSNVSLTIDKGEFVSLTGRSGSGKSTLLYIMSSLDNPTEGSVEIDGVDIASMKQSARHQLRNTRVGFVFQFHYLISELTALENVLMPAVKTRRNKEKTPQALALLKQFDLANKTHRLPSQLSGGEQQRVAIARALIMEPEYLFADEPTGNLDSINGEMVMKIFRDINKNKKTTLVMVTHEADFAAYAGRQIQLADGKVISS